MLVSCRQMREAEQRLFASGAADADTLMEIAGRTCAELIQRRCRTPASAILYVGKGNNGGDALVIGRELRLAGWRTTATYAGEPPEMTELAASKRTEFEATPNGRTGDRGQLILIDGLLGIGASGPLRGSVAELAALMNRQREEQQALTFSIDIPSGVDGDTGECRAGAVIADHTLTIAQVKPGLLADTAVNHVGRIDVVELPQIEIDKAQADTGAWLMTPKTLRGLLPRRQHDHHKGDAGRIGIIAGSPGMIGAAELCARGALRGGAGLVTLFAHPSIYQLLASRLPAEIMVRRLDDDDNAGDAVKNASVDVLAIGPGIGGQPPDWLINLILSDSRPIVLDADALNALAWNPDHLAALVASAAPRLLTPHPGEMKRLLESSSSSPGDRTRDRRSMAEHFATAHGITLLLKGARTVVAEKGRPTAINSTGNPGMASGGMGDVQTGLCAALLAATNDPFDAACLGVWLAGRSADLLVDSGARSVESLSATDVADGLGAAFDDLRRT